MIALLRWAAAFPEAFIKSRLNVHDWEDLMRIHLSGPSPDRAEVRATLTAALRRFSQEL